MRRIIALLRVSTDQQDTERQRLSIDRYAAAHGLKIDEWLRDKEARDLSELRPEFQRLMALVQAGKVAAIIIEKFDRFGVASPDEWFYYRHICNRAGCKIVSVTDGDLTAKDVATAIQSYFSAAASVGQQRTIGHQAISGKRAKSERGEWVGGRAPLGFDKVCRDASGNDLWRLVRTEKKFKQIFAGHQEVMVQGSPGHGKDERLFLDVNQQQAELVRRIFHIWTTQRITLMGVAITLNRAGITLHGKPFSGSAIRRILSNRKYLGDAVWNEHPMGRFKQLVAGQVVDVSDDIREAMQRNPNNRRKRFICRKQDAKNIVIGEDAHPAIVDRNTFERAQEKLAAVKDNKNRAALAPCNESYFLKGLVFCAGCQRAMKPETHKGKVYYLCPTYAAAEHQGLAAHCGCGRNTITQGEAEKLILDWVQEKKVALDRFARKPDACQLFQAIRDMDSTVERMLALGLEPYLDQMIVTFELASDPLTSHQAEMVRLIEQIRAMDLETIMVGMEAKYERHSSLVNSKRVAKASDFPTETKAFCRLNTLVVSVSDQMLARFGDDLKKVYRQKAKAETDHEMEFWEEEQRRLERHTAELKEWAVPYSDRLKEAVKRLERLRIRLEESSATYANATLCQKGEILRGVVARLTLHFRKVEPHSITIRKLLAEHGQNTSSKDLQGLLTAAGINLSTSTIATLRSRRTAETRWFYALERHELQSSISAREVRTR